MAAASRRSFQSRRYATTKNMIIGYLLIGTDNTARKRIEAKQKKLDQRLRDQQFYTRSLIESNIDALMTTDPSGIITDVNKADGAAHRLHASRVSRHAVQEATSPIRNEPRPGSSWSSAKRIVRDYELTSRRQRWQGNPSVLQRDYLL
jgi:PAS domain-containing protein